MIQDIKCILKLSDTHSDFVAVLGTICDGDYKFSYAHSVKQS